MSIAVTPNLTDISLCDVLGLWTGSSIAIDGTLMVQGAGCCSIQVKATTSATQLWTYTEANGIDMTGKHIYIWMMVTGVVDTKANGGYRIYVEDKDGNNSLFYVGGKDTHPGGWGCFVVNPASTVRTSGTGTVNPLYIKKVGVAFKTLSTALGSVKNCFWDACRYGTGLTITSGATDAINFEAIYNADMDAALTYRWGVVTKGSGGIYLIQGLLTFGGTGAENIDFVDKGQIIVFPDNSFVSDTFYGIQVLAGSGVINFILGEKSGTAGIKGCLLKAPGIKTFSLNVSDSDIDKMQLYGCNFNNAGIITLLPNAANREVLNCSFEGCSGLVINTCVVLNCNFISSDAEAILMSSISHNITYCNFIACPVGVKIDTYNASAYPFNSLIFTNCTKHVNNTSGQTLIVGNANGSNASTYVGTLVNFVGSVVLTMIVKDEAGNGINNAWAYIDDSLDEPPFIMNKLTALVNEVNGVATETYTGAPINATRWRVRKYGYKNFKQLIDIGSLNISLPVTLVLDSQQS